MTEIICLSNREMLKIMRSFSDTNKKAVDRYIWKNIKEVAMHSNDCFKVDSTAINTSDRCWSVRIHPSIQSLIDYIFCYHGNMTTTACACDMNIANSFYATNCLTSTLLTSDNTNANIEQAKKEKNKSMFNFDFGKVTSDAVRISMYGIAVKNIDGRYVSYDVKTHSIMDVEILNMPADNFLYKMPVAIKDVKAGDVVIHNRVPMFVVETHESTMKVIDIREGMEKEIYLTKSPFGFNFATKVVSLMDVAGNKADENNPFGSMLPLMFMNDADPTMTMMMLMNQNTNLAQNPTMLYLLMKDGNQKDMLPMLLMMNTKE